MSIEQRINLKFLIRLEKTPTETANSPRKVKDCQVLLHQILHTKTYFLLIILIFLAAIDTLFFRFCTLQQAILKLLTLRLLIIVNLFSSSESASLFFTMLYPL